jgi:hypothetical protein
MLSHALALDALAQQRQHLRLDVDGEDLAVRHRGARRTLK